MSFRAEPPNGPHGVELPFGDREKSWWVDDSGVAGDSPIKGAERLPGGYVLAGLVAVHTTLPDVGALVSAGVDSIGHGPGLDASAIEEMGRRGVAWTPTLCALFGAAGGADAPPEEDEMAVLEARARFAELLPLAVRHGVPVLAGTDVVGPIPREMALLTEMGLEPKQALAAASDWARRAGA